MQKQIVYVCNLFFTITMYAMEPLYPQIIYNKDSTPNFFAEKLSEKFTIACTQEKNILSHESPEISCIHSDEYLQNLDKHTSSTLSAINNSMFTWLCPNRYSKSYLRPMLNNVSTTVAATECVMTTHNIPKYKPRYAIALAEGYSFAGYDHGSNGDVYATIPIAAAYALNKNNNIKRILVIDENITPNTSKYYFEHGNGSIFFPKNNPQLSALFENKIIMENQMSEDLNDFLYNDRNAIDVALYNINIDDVEPIEEMHPNDAKERKSKIYALLYHLIPTIFILSGDKNIYQDMAYSLITYISQTAEKIAALSPLERFEQDIQQTKQKFITSAQNLMSIFEKKRLSIPIPSPLPSPKPSPRKIPTCSLSSSSSCSDLEQERRRLKKRLDMLNSSSSTDDIEDISDEQ